MPSCGALLDLSQVPYEAAAQQGLTLHLGGGGAVGLQDSPEAWVSILSVLCSEILDS